MGLKDTFEKQGGIKLLKQYWQSGAFFTAVGEFLLLGKRRTALEILRLSTQLKTKQKLEKRYRKKLEEFDKTWQEIEHKSSNKVWICWFQGIENAPLLVQKCYQSVVDHMTDRDITLITADNLMDYVQFPDYILQKWNNGQITHTHMTDLLRLELLTRHGGLWLDATVFCSGNDIPDYMTESDLFFFQILKPGRDGHASYISSWLISAKTNNKLLCATLELLYDYWKENSSMLDYFLLHDFMSIVLDKYPEEWKKIIPRDNAAPHILLLRLFERYDQEIWESIKGQTPFHKMTYKFSEEQVLKENTFYKQLFKNDEET